MVLRTAAAGHSGYVSRPGAQSLETRVLRLREENPRWGKDTLTPILRREGVAISVSMVGRILTKL